ncbi:DUF453-domain-containing protein [Dothidotthia symphoricarpi CBS 119687]|uniref:DUF453-domain-containing protein n=1 Tax=Dothidotthia symphoricarpi CBS 119687 TaxID=1392245 RepID=A0A6A6AHR9_9PLEO|nr:DUF453-domain-containing protein [Dothidotthia symphoricarpi CBS 119687]KAF2130793.1 DUF453-domain-containing protein [Dothidotthia symphoricarpi CBS 119687]
MRPSPSLLFRIRSNVALTKHNRSDFAAHSQRPLKAAYYRGGTSRAVIIQPQHLPTSRAKWPSIFREIMGSGDPYGRQLDGMGAGISSLSKICLVEPYGDVVVGRRRAGSGGIDDARARAQALETQETGVKEVDLDYTFVGMGIENDEVDVAGNCGNMSSAIGPYAYNAGLLSRQLYSEGDGEVTVKIRNTNTGKFIESTFEVTDGQAAVKGDYTIDGVSGTGSKIKLDFQHPYGSKTGRVLPTGRKVDNIAGYRVSCVDGANPAIFIRADEIGVDGTILPNDFNRLPEKLALLERIRKTAAVAMGIAATEDLVPRTVPKIGLVSMSSTHAVLSGQTLKTPQMDLVVRFLSDTQPHRAIPLTAALTTAVAARIPGTIVEQLLAPDPVMEDTITIGHASGRLQVNAIMEESNRSIPLSATVYRTAKRLFDGNVFWTDKGLDKTEADTGYGNDGRGALGLAFVLESRQQQQLQNPPAKPTLHEAKEPDLVERETEAVAMQKEEARTVPDTRQEAEMPLGKEGEDPSPLVPPSISYRPLQRGSLFTDTTMPTHPPTPLITAITDLQTHLTKLLADPNLATKPYPPYLASVIKSSFVRIADNSVPITPQGEEWQRWSKGLHVLTKADRHRLDKAAKKREKAQKKVEKLARKTELRRIRAEKKVGVHKPEGGLKIEEKEMGDGETGMKDGETGMKDGETGMKDGETGMKDGETGMKDGETEAKDGKTGIKDEDMDSMGLGRNRMTRRTLGLNKYGKLVGGGKHSDEWWSKREEQKKEREARGGFRGHAQNDRWKGRGSRS